MITELLVVFGAVWIGFNIGANDAANCIGACVGGGALGFRRAVLVASLFALVGGMFGAKVTSTISQDILLPQDLTLSIAIVSLLVTGSIVAASTLLGIPVSTSHSIVLSMVGAGFGIQASIDVGKVFGLALAWTLVPLGVMALSSVLNMVVAWVLGRVASLAELEIMLKYMLAVSGSYASFALGASHAGLAGGMLEGAGLLGRFHATLLGAVSIALGVLLMSARVIKTVAEGVTTLTPGSAFAMQIAAAIGLNLCSVLGLPVSSSQCIVTAAVGVGIAQGMRTVKKRQIRRIVLFWIMTPLCSLVATYAIIRLLGAAT